MIRYLVVALGIALWVFTLLHDRPLFLDEANLARNLYDRSPGGLFSPLDHEQYAPPLFLLLAKGLAGLFGYHEWVLRLPAFLGGLIAIAALGAGATSLKLGKWGVLPLALLFVNPTVLRYVTEFKPYGLDLGLAAALIWAHLRWPSRRQFAWLAAGIVLPWLSLPSVFVLAAIGMLRFWRERSFAFVAGAWLLSFGLLYLTVLRPAVGSEYLNAYHAQYFLLPPSGTNGPAHLLPRILALVRLAFGYTVVSLLCGAATVGYGLSVPAVRRYGWLLAPLAIALLASLFRLYTLLDRLLLFTLPGIWLFAALSVQHVYARWSPWPRKLLTVCILLTLGGANIHRAILTPYRYSDGRWLASLTETAKGNYVADASAVPVLDYYRRVKPGRQHDVALRRPEVDGELPWADGRVLFDNVGDPGIDREIKKYRQRATERGCHTTYEEKTGSGSLRIKCPARNYDR